MYQQLIDDFIQQEQLPPSYAADASEIFLPLLNEIEGEIQKLARRPFLLGINGAQGTGKSTLAKLLSLLLASNGYRVATLSLDDFYYSRARRRELAEKIHPLLGSRGVPGTHDVELALRLLQQLRSAGPADSIVLPGFDKASDDLLAADACVTVCGPIDVLILEGWFVGLKPQSEATLTEAINELERNEDKDGRWRRYVNDQLAGNYQTLFGQLDKLLLLQAPGFEQVFEWRSLQEEKLRQQAASDASGLMDEPAIRRFIQHFERLTRHGLLTLPQTADYLISLDAEHRFHRN
ncbi:MAG: hypothetical protein WDZ52_08710 [Pseudohongiellaceae bacterium]